MNLQEAIMFAEILAGGPGSGPNAPCPQCGPKGGKSPLKEQDIVKIMKPDSLWNTKTGNIDKFPAGKLKGVVVNVLPPIGNKQMVKVNIIPPGKKHEADQFRYFDTNDVQLHKSVGETIKPEPVPPSKIKMQYTSFDGAQVTVIKPPKESAEYEPKTLMQLARMPDTFKGQYDLVTKVTPVPKEIEEEYMPEKYEKHTSYVYDASKESGVGKTISVFRYPSYVVVREQHYTQYSHIDRPPITWKYDNVEKARLMLQKRYSIKIGHKELKVT